MAECEPMGCSDCGRFHCICFDPFEDDEPFEYDPGEDCGRWDNGRLGPHCTMAGTEFCDWECPYS
jgi:hypothetical protein